MSILALTEDVREQQMSLNQTKAANNYWGFIKWYTQYKQPPPTKTQGLFY